LRNVLRRTVGDVAFERVSGTYRHGLSRWSDLRARIGWVDLAARIYIRLRDHRYSRVAAGITYYAFVSIFPLLMVATTVLAFVIDDEQRQRLATGALSQVPVLSTTLADPSKPLTGNVTTLVLGLLTALWSGTSCMAAIQDALNDLWGIERKQNPNILRKRGRSLLSVVVVGAGLAVFSAAVQLLSLLGDQWLVRIAGLLILIGVNTAIGIVVFQVLIHGTQSWRALRSAALVFSVGYGALQLVGGYYIDRVVKGASDAYGTFATVLGLLAWLYLVASILLIATAVAAEMAAVSLEVDIDAASTTPREL
jgi:membrane protein